MGLLGKYHTATELRYLVVNWEIVAGPCAALVRRTIPEYRKLAQFVKI